MSIECEKQNLPSNEKRVGGERARGDDEQGGSGKTKHSAQRESRKTDKGDGTDHAEQRLLRSCSSVITSRGSECHESFAARQNFCVQMRRYNQDTVENPELYLGYLEINKDEIHRVSFSDAYLTLGRYEPIPLVQVFRTFFTGRNTESMPHERVELAKQYASAMLQFQRTPLLYKNWSSNDIMFFGKPQDRIEAEESFRGPHLNVCIQEKPQLGDEKGNINEGMGKQPGSEEFIFSQSLFELAIMLVEIGFQAPLADIVSPRIPDDATDTSGDEIDHHDKKWNFDDQARWFAADKLCDDVATHLGSDYRDVVRRCLDSCLNQGENNIQGEEYDAFIYTDVINMLDEIQA